MNKQQAIEVFGSGAALARALGVTRGAISLWPEVLDQRRADQVNGAAARLGLTSQLKKASRRQSNKENKEERVP